MKEYEINIGDYFWAYCEGELGVFVKQKNGIFIAGNWEGEYGFEELELVELIPRPEIKVKPA